MKYVLGILFMLICTNYSYCAEPITDLEPLPSLSEFQTYEDSELWFHNQMLEYYKTASMYYAQVNYHGAKPVVNVIKPSLDDLESLEFKTLRKYYQNAELLRNQIISLPNGDGIIKITELRETINGLNARNNTLTDSLYLYRLNATKSEFYKERYEEMVAQIDSLQHEFETKTNSQYKNLIEMNRTVLRMNRAKYSVVSLGISGTQFQFDAANVNELLSPGISISLNPGKMFGIGRIFEFWGEYSYLLNDISSYNSKSITNGVHRVAGGVSWIIDLSKLMSDSDYNLFFNVGLGYFHSVSKAINSGYASSSCNGNSVKLEFVFDNYSNYFPFGIFAQVNFNRFNKDLLMLNRTVVPENSWVTNYSIGIKLPLWQDSNNNY